jgi:hypothetical protein
MVVLSTSVKYLKISYLPLQHCVRFRQTTKQVLCYFVNSVNPIQAYLNGHQLLRIKNVLDGVVAIFASITASGTSAGIKAAAI